MEFTVKTSSGQYDIEAYVRCIGKDLLVAIWGGERPHIGAVGIAQPRPSLKDPGITSSTASVFCFLGHKEDDPVRMASGRLSAALNANVVVTAGIHWDNLDPEGILQVMSNCEALVELIIDRIGSGLGKPP